MYEMLCQKNKTNNETNKQKKIKGVVAEQNVLGAKNILELLGHLSASPPPLKIIEADCLVIQQIFISSGEVSI